MFIFVYIEIQNYGFIFGCVKIFGKTVFLKDYYLRYFSIIFIIILFSGIIIPANAAPTEVLSPVMGPLYQTTGPAFSLQYDKWYFWQHQDTEGHSDGYHGIGGANDYYAWDVNLHTATNSDFDSGQPVYAVESGTVAQTFGGALNTDGTVGQVLIDHSGWYSGYVHMNKIAVTRGQSVTKDTILGYISKTGADNNHLHFAVYTGTNTYQGLKSFNCIIQPRSENIPTLLDPPVLVNPGLASSPGSTISTLTPTFSWQLVSGADQYGLYISDITNGEVNPPVIFNSVSYGATLTGTSYSLPSGLLQNNRKYRWNMNSQSSAGWGSANTGRFYFQTSVSNADPRASFTGLPPSGKSPLTVQFTDTSTGTPTGWAWFFGDENYSQAWTRQTSSAEWPARQYSSSVVMPDGSIIMMGQDDAWKSTDKGATWTQQTANIGWSAARVGYSSVVMPDRSILLMGGATAEGPWGTLKNDVWRSTDAGVTWTQVTSNAGWPGRCDHTSVVMPDGSIVLMGGGVGNQGRANDVWRSTDNGVSWTQMTSNAEWEARHDHSSVAMPDGSIILMGGFCYSKIKNDVWRSTDNGATWTQITASSPWSERSYHSSVVMPDGSIILMGGIGISGRKNDVYRSIDNGASWIQIKSSAEWEVRGLHSSVVMPDGSIILMGGDADSGYKNDVWRFTPTGSSVKNPSHTYTRPGNYPVTLQVFDAGGYSSTRKDGYIAVSPMPGYVWIQQNSSRYTIADDRSVVNAQGGYSEMNPGIQLKNLPFSAASPVITNLNNYGSGDNTVRIFDYQTNGFTSITLPERSTWSSGSDSIVAIPKQGKTYLFSLQEQSGGGTSGCPKTVTIASVVDYPDLSGSSTINLEIPITSGCPWVEYAATLDGDKIYALAHSDKKYLYEIDLTSSKYETLNSVFNEKPLAELPDDLPIRYPSYIHKLTDTTYLFYQYQGSEVYSNVLYNSASKSWIEFPDYGKNYARMIWHQKKDNYFYALFSQSDSFSIYPYRMMRIDLQNLNTLNSNSQLFENYWSSRQVINKYGTNCDDGTIMHRPVPCSPISATPLVAGDTLYSIEQYSSVRPYDTELGNITSINLWTGAESTEAINRLYNTSSATLTKILYPQQKVSIISPVVVNTTAHSLFFVNTTDIASLLSLKQNEYSQCYVIGEDDVKTNLLCTNWNSATKIQRFTAIDVSYETTGTNPNTPSAFSPGSLISPGPELSSLTPEFSWPKVTGADGYGLYIRDMDSNILVFDSRSKNIPIIDTKYSLPTGILENGKKYRWNMNAHTSAGWGSYSDRLCFRAPAPSALLPPPVLDSPGTSEAPGPNIPTRIPDFKWQQVTGADKYGLYITDITNGEEKADEIFNSEFRGKTITGSNYTLPSDLDLFHDGKKYRWNMRSHNSDGWGSYSQNLSFQTPAINQAQIPVADFTWDPSPLKVYDEARFYASSSSSPDGSGISTYIWRVDDGYRETKTSPTFKTKFRTLGTHSVELSVINNRGIQSSPKIKTFEVIGEDAESTKWYIELVGPEKTSNWERKHYEIIVHNQDSLPTGQIIIKLSHSPEYTVIPQFNPTATTPIDHYFDNTREDHFYFKDDRVLTKKYWMSINGENPTYVTQNNKKEAYWIIDNINGVNSEYLPYESLPFEMEFKTDSKDEPDLFMDVSAKQISKLPNNAFFPGIGWSPSSVKFDKEGNDRLIKATELDADLIKCLYQTNDKSKLPDAFKGIADYFDLRGAFHTWLASLEYHTEENIIHSSEGNGDYDIVFSHSGGTQTLYRKLLDGNVTTDYAFFAAPALISQSQMEELITKGAVRKKIFIIQSKQDILYNTHILDLDQNHEFSKMPFIQSNKQAGVNIEIKNAPEDFLKPIIGQKAPEIFPFYQNYIKIQKIFENEKIDTSKIPEKADFWIGGANRKEQELFTSSKFPGRINTIDLTFDHNSAWYLELIGDPTSQTDAHTFSIEWIIEQYTNGKYPFDGSIWDLKTRDIEGKHQASKIIDYTIAHDPNEKTGPEGHYPADKPLTYRVEYENEGEGTAYGVYVTDILDLGLDNSTLEISPVYSVATGLEIAERGTYFPENRTIFWDIGKVPPGEGGYSNISVKFLSTIPDGTKVVNYATVYFPNAFEETKTNSIVTIKGVNLPPDTPNLTYPEPGVMDITVNGTLFWKGHEPNNETLQYDVYLGPSTPPPRILENTSYEYYYYSNLTSKTLYYWKIVAKDPYGAETSSAIQQFTITSGDTQLSANLTANITSGPAPLFVQFTDTSTGSPTSWNWSFGDKSFSTLQNPNHTYSASGLFNVTLFAANANGNNTFTKTNYINVTAASVPVIIDGQTKIPTDIDGDGLYEDLNGNNALDFNDVQVFFRQMDGISSGQPIALFDFNHNGGIDFNDIQLLFRKI